MAATDVRTIFKALVELVRPDLRHYYKMVRKGRVVRTYASDGRYWCDVQPLRNDETVDPKEPVLPRVEIPIIWGGPNRGVVCPPAVGAFCDIDYYDGDPNYPRVSNFRWHGQGAPALGVGEFVIQQTPGTFIKIEADGRIVFATPTGLSFAGNGDESSPTTITLKGDLEVQGNIHATGTIIDDTGNTPNHGH